MNVKIEDNQLIIKIPILVPPRLSKSKKTKVLCSSDGNRRFNIEGQDVYVNLTVFFYSNDEKEQK